MGSRGWTLVALLAILVGGLVASGCGGGGTGGREITIDAPVRLERNFKEGDVFKYKLKMNDQSGIKLTSYERTISSQAEFKTTNTITSVTDDDVEMAMRFDYAVGAMTVGDAMMPNESMSSLRGKEMTFTLEPDGTVQSWSGLTGEDAAESGAGQLALLLVSVFPPLPKEPVTIGTTWSKPVEVPEISSAFEQEIVGETVYTVTGFRSKYDINCVEIRGVTDFEFEGRVEQGGDVYSMSGAGTSTGTMLVSIEDGSLVVSSAEVNTALTAEGATVAGAAAGETVEVGTKTQLTVELL
jgi:hypothetical protein